MTHIKTFQTYTQFINENINESWQSLGYFTRQNDGERVTIKYYKEPGTSGVAKAWQKHLEKGTKFPSGKMNLSYGSDITNDTFTVIVGDKDIVVTKTADDVYKIERKG